MPTSHSSPNEANKSLDESSKAPPSTTVVAEKNAASWQPLSSSSQQPSRRLKYCCGLAVVDKHDNEEGEERLMAVGGESWNTASDIIHVWNGSTWQTMTTKLQTPRTLCIAVAHQKKQLYVFGGYHDHEAQYTYEVLDLGEDGSKKVFREGETELPFADANEYAPVSYHHSIFLVGREIWEFDTRSESFQELQRPSSSKRDITRPAVVMVHDTLVVAGGKRYDSWVDTVETFHVPTRQWTNVLPNLPMPLSLVFGYVLLGERNSILTVYSEGGSSFSLDWEIKTWGTRQEVPPIDRWGQMVIMPRYRQLVCVASTTDTQTRKKAYQFMCLKLT